MKHIFTLFTALVLMAATQINTAAAQGTIKPFVSPNPAHDYIKVNWTQSQCDNVIITMYYANGAFARTLLNRIYCDGDYNPMFKIAGMHRGGYYVKVQIGNQMWTYKLLLQ